MPGRIYRTHHDSEVEVYEALAAQLPEDWVAWHSLSIRTESGRYGEGDFIIAAPEWGFLVLEVKGGEVYERNGHWYQGNKRLVKGPLAQAHDYRSKFHAELRRVYERYEVEGKCAVCLPHVSADNRPTNSDYRDILIDRSQLGDLVGCLRKAFACQFQRGNAPPNREWIERITELWGDNWEPAVGLMGQARLQMMERENLNALQLGVLEGLVENQNVLVSGAAGTGKTTVATQLAVNWAWSGKSVRYFCFTEPLAHWLEQRFASEFEHYDADIKAVPVRARAEQLAVEWGSIGAISWPRWWSSSPIAPPTGPRSSSWTRRSALMPRTGRSLINYEPCKARCGSSRTRIRPFGRVESCPSPSPRAQARADASRDQRPGLRLPRWS
jgi:hypothetical protein